MNLSADLVLKNGSVILPKGDRSQALAVRGDRIVAIGSNDQIEAFTGAATNMVDLGGRTVLPGFIDAHQHLFSYGITMKTWIDLSGTESSQDILDCLAARLKACAQTGWILGRGWSEESLVDGRLPTRWELDKVAPDNPVAFKDISGHYCVSNSLGLKAANLTQDTPQPKSGWIDRDPETNEPNGILRESAMSLVWNQSPPPSWAEILEAVELGAKHANSLGVTSVHTVGIPLPQGLGYTAEELKAYTVLRRENRLTVRTYLLIPVWKHVHHADDTQMLDHQIELGQMTGFGDSLLQIGAAKIFVDGSLNARSAALYEPYTDDPSTSGMMFYTQDELNEVMLKAHRAGFQMAVHAHGDRAVDAALNAFERALTEHPRDDHRHRIKHVELLTDQQIERIRSLGLLVTSIPSSAGFSPWYQEMAKSRVGPERKPLLHRYRDVMDSGILVAGGTDGHPIGKYLSPLQGLRDRVRVARFTLQQAFEIQTINSAFASFEDNLKGSIEVGKLADLVVLAEDPFQVEVDRIPDIKVEKTILGGLVVYKRAASA